MSVVGNFANFLKMLNKNLKRFFVQVVRLLQVFVIGCSKGRLLKNSVMRLKMVENVTNRFIEQSSIWFVENV